MMHLAPRPDPKTPTAKATTKAPRTASDSIARMPRAIRDKISSALTDGCTWRTVAKIAAEAGYKGVNAQNVSNYRKGGHLDWLRNEERLEVIRRESDTTAHILRFYAEHGGSPAEAGVLAASEIMAKALSGMDAGTLQILMADDPSQFLKIAGSLVNISKFLEEKKTAARAEIEKQESTTAGNSKKKGISAATIARVEEQLKLL